MSYHTVILGVAADEKISKKMQSALEASGLSVFYRPFGGAEDGETEAAITAAIRNSRTTLLIYTDSANMESDTVKYLDRASKCGSEVVTLRLSGSPALSRTGFYMTIPYTVDARETDPAAYTDALISLMKSTLLQAEENRAKKLRKNSLPDAGVGFRLPGFGGRNRLVSLAAGAVYAAALLFLLALWTGIDFKSGEYLPELLTCCCFTLMFLLPVLILGNAGGVLDRFPPFRSRKPFSTLLGILAADLAVYGIFALILRLLEKR